MIKEEIRVLGVACVALHVRGAVFTHIVGVVYRGKRWLEGVMRITVSGEERNLTPAIIRMVVKSPHYPQLQVITLDELTVRSGKYIDIETLNRRTRLSVIAVLCRKIPAKHVRKNRMVHGRELIEPPGLPYVKWSGAGKMFFVYFAGVKGINLSELLGVCASSEGIPEATRVARFASSSLVRLLKEGKLNPVACTTSGIRSFL